MPDPSITLSARTRSPTASVGSSAPHTPAETTRGRSSSATRTGQRSFSREAPIPTGAMQTRSERKARNGRDGRVGRESARASARVSSSTAVRTRIAATPVGTGRRAPERLFLLLALDPGLPAIAGRGVLPREPDGGDIAVRNGEGAVPLLVEKLDEGLGRLGVAVEDVADDLGAVTLGHGGVAPIVEGELYHLAEREVLVDLRHPALEGHGLELAREGDGHRLRETLQGAERVVHRGRLVATVHHAVAALLVAALLAVVLPPRSLHQLLEARGVALLEEVAGALPAEHIKGGVAPRGALEVVLAHQET